MTFGRDDACHGDPPVVWATAWRDREISAATEDRFGPGLLAGGQRSFANAELLLKEFLGWHVSDERVRQACHAEADRVAAWRADAPAPAGAQTPPVEFQADATKVNTTGGWRDTKLGVFAWRPAGPAASPDAWDQRALPTPTHRLAFTAVSG